MKELKLYGHKDYLSCEITKVLNTYNPYKDKAWELYLCVHPEGCLVIRGIGATRGCIHFNEQHIITEIVVYEHLEWYNEDCIFKKEDKEKIIEEMNKFIGYKII